MRYLQEIGKLLRVYQPFCSCLLDSMEDMAEVFCSFCRLGLNSFEKDVSGAVMDIEADEQDGMRKAKAIKTW